MKALFCLLLVAATFAACTKTNEETELAKYNGGSIDSTACDTTNMSFATDIKPIIMANCFSCHGNGRTMGGINFDTYAKVKQQVNNAVLLGVITHAPGYYPMPQNLPKLPACTINKIKSWIASGAPDN